MKNLIALLVVLTATLATSQDASQVNDEQACYRSLSGFSADPSTIPKPIVPNSLTELKLEFSVSGCLGRCPAFSAVLTSSSVEFEGHAYVRAIGKRRARLSAAEFERFVDQWFDSRFDAMRDDYCTAKCPDGTERVLLDVQKTSISMKAPVITKTVTECYVELDRKPDRPRAPQPYYELRKELLAFLKSKAWL